MGCKNYYLFYFAMVLYGVVIDDSCSDLAVVGVFCDWPPFSYRAIADSISVAPVAVFCNWPLFT